MHQIKAALLVCYKLFGDIRDLVRPVGPGLEEVVQKVCHGTCGFWSSPAPLINSEAVETGPTGVSVDEGFSRVLMTEDAGMPFPGK